MSTLKINKDNINSNDLIGTGKLVSLNTDGKIDADITGNSATATSAVSATYDNIGNNIANTYTTLKSSSMTLLAASWSSGTYTITDSNVKTNNLIIATLSVSANATQYDAISAAELTATSQTAGTLVLTAFGSVPTIDIPMILWFLG
jgi:hypothetical protein